MDLEGLREFLQGQARVLCLLTNIMDKLDFATQDDFLFLNNACAELCGHLLEIILLTPNSAVICLFDRLRPIKYRHSIQTHRG